MNPHLDYPPEEDKYIRGNDFSPVAVAAIFPGLGQNQRMKEREALRKAKNLIDRLRAKVQKK